MNSVGIIGYGSFGQFIHELIRHYYPDAAVHCFDSARMSLGTLEAAALSDVVFLAVPIAAYEHALFELAPHLGPTSLLIDVATVKVHTTSLLHRHGGIRYVATHPMFGPYSYIKKGKQLKGLRLVLAEHTLNDDELLRMLSTLERLGLSVLHMSPDEHDKMLAETLFLTHYVGQVVTKGGFRRTDIDTLSFGFLMDAVESVQNDKQLFQDVFRYNPYCREVLGRFEEAEAETAATFGLL